MDWQLGDVQTSPKGIRSAPLTDSKGNPIIVHLADLQKALTAPFGSSAFNDPTAARQHICFRIDSELQEKIAYILFTKCVVVVAGQVRDSNLIIRIVN